MARRTQTFLKEFVVLFGFLNGVWVAVGVNPARTLLEVAKGYFARLFSGAPVDLLFALVPLVLVVVFLVLIWRKGGALGLVAVLLAFLGGVQILTNAAASFVLLLGALAVGYFATR